MTNSLSKRVLWRDIARGIGIVLVVYGHILGGMLEKYGGTVKDGSWLFCSHYAVSTFHMPLFFLLAGWNFDHSFLNGTKNFLGKKLWLLVYPYFLWSFIQGGIKILLASYLNNPPVLHDLLFLAWKPIDQYWFLYALFLCHMIAISLEGKLKFLFPVSFLSYLYFVLIPPNTAVYQASKTEYMLIFYAFGILLSRHDFTNINLVKTRYLCFLCIVLTATYLLGIYWGIYIRNERYYNSNYTLNIISSLACISGILLIIILSQWIERYLNRIAIVMAKIGTASMTIYVMHVLTGCGIRIVLRRTGIENIAVLLTVGTLIGVLLPYAAHRFLKKYNLLWPLGLAFLPTTLSKRVGLAILDRS